VMEIGFTFRLGESKPDKSSATDKGNRSSKTGKGAGSKT
jgi:hypothetical protein